MKLFESHTLGNIQLDNKVVMAPMTRSRASADTNTPGDIVATYYAQRAGAGLIVTEGTSPSPNGLGYARIPGIFSTEQINGWKAVTDAVHAEGGRIFLQIMHTGRVTHIDNLPEGAEVVAPTGGTLTGEMYTDGKGMQPHSPAREMSKADIDQAIQEYVQAAKNAVAAGFDGIELHGANGYLLEQFLSPHSNKREDEYGGNIQNRLRFVLEVVAQTIAAIGKEKIGIRLSPYGVFNDMAPYDEAEETYAILAKELDALGVVYVHLVDHEAMGAPAVPESVVTKIRAAYQGNLILSGGYDKARAEEALQSGKADLVAIGRPFIANPDLVSRMKTDAALAEPDYNTFYTPGTKGYTDYPSLELSQPPA
ncbi:MAG: alkene reductase [Bacteroidota bacterium]